MANKNHALDELIDRAAMDEFLLRGYEKASMRTIAEKATVTVGAIYTRYSTKDILFCSMVRPLIEKISLAFGSIRSGYYSAAPTDPQSMAQAMAKESEDILHLLFDDYERAVLLLCRSRGSSLEGFFDRVVEEKISETLKFFEASGVSADGRVLKLLINSQFNMYFQIINEGYRLEDAKHIMSAAMIYNSGGWMALFSSGKNNESMQEAQDEI